MVKYFGKYWELVKCISMMSLLPDLEVSLSTALPILMREHFCHFLARLIYSILPIFDILNQEKVFFQPGNRLVRKTVNEWNNLLGTESINNPVHKINGLEHFSLQYFFSGVLLVANYVKDLLNWEVVRKLPFLRIFFSQNKNKSISLLTSDRNNIHTS